MNKTNVLTLAIALSLSISERLHDPLCGTYPQMGMAQLRVRKLIELILTKSPDNEELRQIESAILDECVTVFVNDTSNS